MMSAKGRTRRAQDLMEMSLRARLPRKRGLYTKGQKAHFSANIADVGFLSLGGIT